MIKLSVIVPIYNTQNHLEQCLDSILNQKLNNIEIILVNDGSTDFSTEILRKYKNNHPDKITLIEQENGGMSIARNRGLEIAKGEYLGFVDSDDWIEPEMFHEMTQLADKERSDIVICNTADHYPTYTVYHDAAVFDSKFTVTPSACNKIFRRDFVGDLRFPENLWYEDFCFTTIALLKTERISVVPKTFYNCHCREVSIMNNNNSLRNLDILKVLDIIKQYMIDNDMWNQDAKVYHYFIVDHVLITSINRLALQNNDSKKKIIKELIQYAKKNKVDFTLVKEHFDISSKRYLIAKLNFHGFWFISKSLLSITAKIKGR